MAEERRLSPVGVVRESGRAWIRHGAGVQAAALAFYSLISLAPVLALLLTFSAAFFNADVVRRRIEQDVRVYAGGDAAGAVGGLLASAVPVRGLLPLLVEVGTALLGATAVFTQLQNSLNLVWEVAPRPGRMVHTLARKRLLSFAMVLLLGALLVTSVGASLLISTLGDRLGVVLDVPSAALRGANALVIFTLLTVLFAALYKTIPDAQLHWRDVLFGSALTALLFVAGKYAIAWWLSRGLLATAYGAASSLVVLMLWIYYTSLVLLFGAEVTRVYSRRFRPRGVVPAPGARRRRFPRLRRLRQRNGEPEGESESESTPEAAE